MFVHTQKRRKEMEDSSPLKYENKETKLSGKSFFRFWKKASLCEWNWDYLLNISQNVQ